MFICKAFLRWMVDLSVSVRVTSTVCFFFNFPLSGAAVMVYTLLLMVSILKVVFPATPVILNLSWIVLLSATKAPFFPKSRNFLSI